MSNVKQGKLVSGRTYSGQRRTLVEEYYAALNWEDRDDAQKFLKVLGYTLAQTYLEEAARNELRRMIQQADLSIDGFVIHFKSELPQKKPDVDTAQLSKLKEQLISLLDVEPHLRGFRFEDFLKDMFELHNLAPRKSFKLVGEQIDGSFKCGDAYYLLEAKWQKEQTRQSDLLIFREKVESKSTWSRGLFVSYGGFTEDGIEAFARGRATNIIGMTGEDLFYILSGEMAFVEAICQKTRKAAETGEFYVSVFSLLRG
jgi:hypothetical protein